VTGVDASDRPARQRADKFAERRHELAEAALQTLAQLGYARTSLREIAQNSAFSHGVLHYYFADKVDLLTYCIHQYKAQCVLRYDRIVTKATTADELAEGFADGLVATLREEGNLHRLWYDLRSQAMFDEPFRADVLEIDESLERMIWRIVTRYAELADVPMTATSSVAYATFDGAFQLALLRHLAGQPNALDDLRAHALLVLTHVTCTPIVAEPVS
jgi:AcrR family transcriptional regulator